MTTSQERERVSSIYYLGIKYNVPQPEIQRYVDEGTPLEDFQQRILAGMKCEPIATRDSDLGFSTKEREGYSLTRAIMSYASGEFDGLEREASDAIAKRTGKPARGFYVPVADLSVKRTMSAGTASAGGYLVGTDTRGDMLIEALRNRTTLSELGVRTLTGLRGNVSIPKQSGGATVEWLGESEKSDQSDQSLESVNLTPKRMAATTAYSKQLLSQSSVDVESFVRNDLVRILQIEMDRVGIAGSGTGGEPLGILNTPGINTSAFTTPTWAEVVNFESAVAADNADVESMAWLVNPSTRATMKSAQKISGEAQFIWESDNTVAGYRAFASNQIASNNILFGNFGDAIFGLWEGLDLIVDPYSRKREGLLEITAQQMIDFAVRHAESFCKNT